MSKPGKAVLSSISSHLSVRTPWRMLVATPSLQFLGRHRHVCRGGSGVETSAPVGPEERRQLNASEPPSPSREPGGAGTAGAWSAEEAPVGSADSGSKRAWQVWQTLRQTGVGQESHSTRQLRDSLSS